LSLSTAQSWEYTPKEFEALARVRREALTESFHRWAIERAEFRNAHQMFGEEGIPWLLSDFTGGDRAQRAREHQSEALQQKVMTTRMQRALGAITSTSKPEEHPELPTWAVRKWKPEDYPELFK